MREVCGGNGKGEGVRSTSGKDWLWEATRWSIYARDSFRCAACGKKKKLSVDHVVPSGGNHPTNLVTLCLGCNSAKGCRSFKAWRADRWDDVLCLLASPLDRALGRELAREKRPGRMAAQQFRSSPKEKRRRREAVGAYVASFATME